MFQIRFSALLRHSASIRAISLFGFIAVMAVAGLANRIPERLTYTGDEPRYLLYSLSFALQGVPVMTEAGYEEFRKLDKPGIHVTQYSLRDIQGESRTPGHSIILSLLLAPVSAIWPLERIRLISLFFGVIGLCFLAKLILKQTTRIWSAIACFAPAALCLPALPFQFLALPEIFLFALVSIAFWNLCSTQGDRLRLYLPSILCSCFAPFLHLRGLALFGTVGACLFLRLVLTDNRPRPWRSVVILCSVYLLDLALVLFFNWAVTGGMLGSVSGIRPVWNVMMLERMFIDFRFGLLTYSPIWLLSFSGLLAALWKRRRWTVPSVIFLLALVWTSTGIPGECYPARFWVQAVPVLALCLLGFVQGALARPIKVLIYGALFAVSLANSLLFFTEPDFHLAARSGAYPYDRLFEIFPRLHLGFWIDVFDSSHVRTGMVCFCLIAVILFAVASAVRSKVGAALAVVVLIIGFEAHRASPLKVSSRVEGGVAIALVAKIPRVAHVPIRLRVLGPWREDMGGRVSEVIDGERRWKAPVTSAALLYYREENADVPILVHVESPPGSDVGEAAIDAQEFQAVACRSLLARFW